MKRVVIGVLVLGAIGGIWFAMSDSSKRPSAKTEVTDGTAPDGEVDTSTSGRKSLMPQKFPGQEDAPEVAPEDREHVKTDAPTNPAAGLEMVPATSTDRERAKVPDKRWGRGVLVMRVAPDSAADEVRLRKGDLIVRAHRTDINQPQDLIDAADGRDHVVVTFIRNGKYLQVVLKKPYDPED